MPPSLAITYIPIFIFLGVCILRSSFVFLVRFAFFSMVNWKRFGN